MRKTFNAFVFLAGYAFVSAGQAMNLSGTVFEEVGLEKGLDPLILYSVALAESAYRAQTDRLVSPSLYTLRTADQPYYFNNKADALSKLQEILKRTQSVDVGPMQINVKWHAHRVNRVEDLLDPATNIRIAADILNERLDANDGDWLGALGQYHSFEKNRSKWYGSLVLNIYKNLHNNSSDLLVW